MKIFLLRTNLFQKFLEMSLLVRQFVNCNKRLIAGWDCSKCYNPVGFTLSRNLSLVPTVFDSNDDPAPVFFAPQVQTLLKRLTRPDLSKVFRKRTNRNSAYPSLKAPKYKFLTTEQLEEEIGRAHRRAEKLLQMPPIVKVRKPVDKVLSQDPALSGLDTAKLVLTDISFGVSNNERIIVERDIDGTLRCSDQATRKRLNQAYFPMVGRHIRTPLMFTDEERLNSLLERCAYEFVLDRACLQYEPDEEEYQRLTSVVYQHVDAKRNYHLLRSTRHFGPLAFYLVWHRSIDGLVLELLQTSSVREAACLVALRHAVHNDITQGELAEALSRQILATPAETPTHETMSEADVELDQKCVECVERYVANNSAMKSLQELALQAFREAHEQQVLLSRGLRKASGSS